MKVNANPLVVVPLKVKRKRFFLRLKTDVMKHHLNQNASAETRNLNRRIGNTALTKSETLRSKLPYVESATRLETSE